MMTLRFVGPDPKVGRQIEGVTYFPGDVADLPELWGRVLVAGGLAESIPPDFTGDRTATVPVTTRGNKR